MKFLLLLSLIIAGCHTPTPAMVYRPTIPHFRAQPMQYPCVIVTTTGEEEHAVCLKVLLEDVLAIVIELRQTCMALGWTERDCQVTFRPRQHPQSKPEEGFGMPGTGA